MAKQDTDNSIKLHVSELQIGMFVRDLDCDWLDTPFIMQGLRIESGHDIDQLAAYCEHVWVESKPIQGKSQYTAHKTLKTKRSKTPSLEISNPKLIAVGSKIYSESHQATMQIMEDIRFGQALNTEQAKTTVKNCVDSIVTDPGTLMLLAKLRDRDNYTSEHSLNVCVLAVTFGRALGFNKEELNNIGICGLLHDIGKMKVPNDVLNKPGALDQDEWQQMRAHPRHGRDLLLNNQGIYHGAIDAAYSHHERVDGKGYPRGLMGKDISTYAKIISICDAYDAMTANRVYRTAISPTHALRKLYDARDKQFDAKLVDTFMEMVGLFPPGSIVELKNGCIGIVISRNLKYQHLPKVLVVRDQSQQNCVEYVVNLAHVEQQKLDRDFLIKRDLVDGSYDINIRDYIEKGLAIAV